MTRFRAPAREELPPRCFDHPAYASFAHHRDLLTGPWPSTATLDARLGAPRHRHADVHLHVRTQTPALLVDGLHYETRIHKRGLIATRSENWHDLFNALTWMTRFDLKCAVNVAYVSELAQRATQPRTRAQCALTHFDEAGALVVLRDPALLACWDAHAWVDLFCGHRARWREAVDVLLFGHALLEHLLVPAAMPVAKCIVLLGDVAPASAMRLIADDIAAARVLRDPQELRPLPLAGIPGWHAGNDGPAFMHAAPCFRPRRAGRVYPPGRRVAATISPAPA